MCRKALDGYLESVVPALNQDTLEALRETSYGSQDEEKDPALSVELANRLTGALDAVRVCDPAVGSGAFLLGTIQEMILLRRGILFSQRGRSFEIDELYDSISDWKQRIITNNLYGVDINAEAVEICRLRLWLSMVMDIPEPPEPNVGWALPNLDFRIVAGDSLVDRVADVIFKESWPTPQALQIGLELRQDINQIERTIARRKEEFDRTHRNPELLRQLRDSITRDQQKIVQLHLADALSKARDELSMRKGIKKGKEQRGAGATTS